MSGTILSFRRAARREALDWTQQELAEFYRVEAALIKAGLAVETDRGLSDEGDPWFVFCRVDDGDVVIHFARIDGEYVVAGLIQEEAARGRDFPALVSALIAAHPVAKPERHAANVVLHPATMLVALVGIALLKSGEVKASAAEHAPEQKAAPVANVPGVGPFGGLINATAAGFSAVIESSHVAAIVAAAGFIASQINFAPPTTDDAPVAAAHQAETASFDVAHYLRAAQAAASEAAGAADHAALAGAAQASLQHVESAEPTPVAPIAQATESAALGGADLLKLLSLVSILWTLPDVDMARAASEITLEHAASLLGVAMPQARGGRDMAEPAQSVEGVASARAGATATSQSATSPQTEPAQKSASADQPQKSVMVIDLAVSGADLPNVMAVKVAMAGATANGIDESHVSAVKELPATLLKVISAADLALSLSNVSAQSVDAQDKVDAATTIPTPAAAAADAIVTYASGNGVVHVLPASADASGVQIAVNAFLHETSGVKMYSDGKDVVFYDSNAIVSNPAGLESETWKFSDGSSISLVGVGFHHAIDLV